MTDHELYEVLCTLAATRQLTAAEKANFDEHCLDCPACRDQLRDLFSVGLQLQLDSANHSTCVSMPSGSLERFRARAIREGITPHSASARRSPSYALASVTAVFVIVATLAFMPHRRRDAGSFAVPTAAPFPSRQILSGSVTERTFIPRPSTAIHTQRVRNHLVPHTDAGVNDASLTAHRFPQAIAANYPFFGQQSATKPSVTGYPALSQSQMPRLDLFRNLDHSSDGNLAGTATPDRTIDIAATGNVFDFTANIRQLHFQLPTAQ